MNLKYFSPCLEEATLVVLLAVLAVVEGLHHLGVLGGGEQLRLLGHLLAVSGISDKSSHLADDPLDALLGLQHGHVHVLHPLQHVGGGRGLVSDGTLLAAGLGGVNIHVDHGGEEEEERGGDQERDDDHGHAVSAGGLRHVPAAGPGGGVAVARLAVAALGGAIAAGHVGRGVAGIGRRVARVRGGVSAEGLGRGGGGGAVLGVVCVVVAADPVRSGRGAGGEEREGGEGGAGVSHGWLVRCAVCNCGAVRLCLYLFVFICFYLL